jgi:hypothetical protein
VAQRVIPEAEHPEIVRLYRTGKTLQEIGSIYLVTRERIRQILRKLDCERDAGGSAVRKKKRASIAASRRDERALKRWGCTWAQYQMLRVFGHGMSRERGPLGAFSRQRCSAHERGIEWRLKLWEWWQIWDQSGKWPERGRGQGYCMARIHDHGAYEVGNVYITSAIDNCSSAPKKRKHNLPLGVSFDRGRYRANRMLNGVKHYIGSYKSPDEAHAAYRAFAPVPELEAA